MDLALLFRTSYLIRHRMGELGKTAGHNLLCSALDPFCQLLGSEAVLGARGLAEAKQVAAHSVMVRVKGKVTIQQH